MLKKIFLGILCVLCISFIIFNSMQTGVKSDQRSRIIANRFINMIQEKRESNEEFNSNIKKVVGVVLKVDSIVLPEGEISYDTWDSFVRRCAHVVEFCILAFIVALTLNIFKVKWYNVIIYTLFIALLGGVLDEFSRQFIQGRHGAINDALLDFVGGILGCIILYIFKLIIYILKVVLKSINIKVNTYRKETNPIN